MEPQTPRAATLLEVRDAIASANWTELAVLALDVFDKSMRNNSLVAPGIEFGVVHEAALHSILQGCSSSKGRKWYPGERSFEQLYLGAISSITNHAVRARMGKLEFTASGENDGAQASLHLDSPLETMIDAESRESTRALIAALMDLLIAKPECSQVATMLADGCHPPEIATRLGLDLGRVHRIKRTIMRTLEGHLSASPTEMKP